MNGALIVDKPEGPTSHDVVAAVRRLLPRGTKVGHTGTLDPLATGVLPLLVGTATRLARFLSADRKRYTATVSFGRSTTTYDRAGDTVRTCAPADVARITPALLQDALDAFRGVHQQVPPAYSAKKVDGRRSYERARAGDLTPPAPVAVELHTVEVRELLTSAGRVEIALECSAGFYVRSLAHALGEAIGVPAHLAALRRTASGAFDEHDATGLGELVTGAIDAEVVLRPLDVLLPDWPSVTLSAPEVHAVVHGQPVTVRDTKALQVELERSPVNRVRLLSPERHLIALARPDGDPPRMLHADVVLHARVD
jgi:tRNA pseudouridine55 synthase